MYSTKLVSGPIGSDSQEVLKRMVVLVEKLRELLPATPRYLPEMVEEKYGVRAEIILGKPFPTKVFLSYSLPESMYTIALFYDFRMYLRKVVVTGFTNGFPKYSYFEWAGNRYVPILDYMFIGDHAFYTLFMPSMIQHLKKYGFRVVSKSDSIARQIESFIDVAIYVQPEVIDKIPVKKIASEFLDKDYKTTYITLRIYCSHQMNQVLKERVGVEITGNDVYLYVRDVKIDLSSTRSDVLSSLRNVIENKKEGNVVLRMPGHVEKYVIPYIKEYLLGYITAHVALRILRS